MEYAWGNYVNGNAEAALRYIDIIYDYIASEENLNMMRENDFLGFICTIRFVDFRKSICEYTEDFSKWVKTFSGQSQDSINIYTATITQNFPFMHRSICDCLEIVVDMDSQLQKIKKVFGAFFYNEIDLFCFCVKAGLYYELNMLEKAHNTILIAQSQLKKGIRFEMQFCIFMLLSQILNAMGKTKESKSAMEHLTGK